MSVERERLNSDPKAWQRWGPYLAERAWGTVREDYSANGDAWNYFPHDHARSRAYRWNEDGLLGISDDLQRLCFALALWNGNDPILKERLFGVTGPEGNHGEDVKEYYYYLDATPTHSYLRALYKYPQRAFPYRDLIETTRRRTRDEPEYELLDTGIFSGNKYFDVMIEYAKAEPRDILIKISAFNRGGDDAVTHHNAQGVSSRSLHDDASEIFLLPTLWYRNTWSWEGSERPRIEKHETNALRAYKAGMGEYLLVYEGAGDHDGIAPTVLFIENETNLQKLYGVENKSRYVKDGINDYVVNGQRDAVNFESGTKAALNYRVRIRAGESATIRLRLMAKRFVSEGTEREPFREFDEIFSARVREADEFYREVQPARLSDDEKLIQRQAFAGMIWSKQFYHYNVERWLQGDPGQPAPPRERFQGRNKEWIHLDNANVISMPDKWEYPWYATWDLAFHCIPFALIDPEFAKQQLILMGREWFQHPNGQTPAYEWNFGDVNPPVLAWAAWRVFTIDRKMTGKGDLEFLERVFHKLMLNFTWWVNRKDAEGRNVFQGGFLGLDNIGVFDRSAPLPTGGFIQQSDGTSWMGMFCIYMLTIALELAVHNRVYEDIATKFFEHFLYIAAAMNNLGGDGIPLWNEQDEFFYDVLSVDDAQFPLKLRSMVGIIPLFATMAIEPDLLQRLPDFRERHEWFLKHRPDLARLISRWTNEGMKERKLVALLRGHRMKRVLKRVLDPNEFLSEYGVRALSKYHAAHPYELHLGGIDYRVEYLPGESDTGLFGGNSNWRGPIWFPVNYLIIESLLIHHHYYGDDFKIECPTGSGNFLTLKQAALFLEKRLVNIFARDEKKQRAVFGANAVMQNDPHWRDAILFYEYFHGETGAGLGASHQTGWTGLIAKILQEVGERGM